MEKSIVFYNVEHKHNENIRSLVKTIYDIFTETMKIPASDVFSEVNPTGEVRIDSVYRMGNKQEGKPKPIVVKLLTKIGKMIVQSKTYTQNLAKNIQTNKKEP